MYDPQGCRTAPLWTRKRIDTNRIGKNPARASYLAAQSLHRLFTGCLWFLNLYGARKLIMHALKLYGPRTGRQNSYGAARGLCGLYEWRYDSLGTARMGPRSVMWLRHYSALDQVMVRWQAICWTRGDEDIWHPMASPSHNELTHLPLHKIPCWLMTSSHSLNHYWLIISDVL